MVDFNKIAEFKSYQSGEEILKSGENQRDLYILAQGKVEAIYETKSREILRSEISAPEIFGEDSFLSELSHPADITAKTDVDLWIIQHQELTDQAEHVLDWLELIVKTLSSRKRDTPQFADLQTKIAALQKEDCNELKLELDLPHKEEMVQQTKPSSENKSTGSLTILVVDDFEPNVMVPRKILEKKGHQVEIAYSGQEALEKLCLKNFDFVLLDVKMPEMDGTEAAALVRKCEAGMVYSTDINQELLNRLQDKIKGGRIPIIAMTAHDGSGEREKCLASGMDDYITKPFHVKSVMDAYEKIISSR